MIQLHISKLLTFLIKPQTAPFALHWHIEYYGEAAKGAAAIRPSEPENDARTHSLSARLRLTDPARCLVTGPCSRCYSRHRRAATLSGHQGRAQPVLLWDYKAIRLYDSSLAHRISSGQAKIICVSTKSEPHGQKWRMYNKKRKSKNSFNITCSKNRLCFPYLSVQRVH